MTSSSAPLVVVMGVSGAGKRTVGLLLARRLMAEFLDAEHLQPARNQERLSAGIPLTETDRRDWLREIAQQLADATAGRHALVVACAALRRADRDLLRSGAEQLALVHLQATPELLLTRPPRRTLSDPPLELQWRMLEPPRPDERSIALDAAQAPADLAAQAADWLARPRPDAGRRR